MYLLRSSLPQITTSMVSCPFLFNLLNDALLESITVLHLFFILRFQGCTVEEEWEGLILRSYWQESGTKGLHGDSCALGGGADSMRCNIFTISHGWSLIIQKLLSIASNCGGASPTYHLTNWLTIFYLFCGASKIVNYLWSLNFHDLWRGIRKKYGVMVRNGDNKWPVIRMRWWWDNFIIMRIPILHLVINNMYQLKVIIDCYYMI